MKFLHVSCFYIFYCFLMYSFLGWILEVIYHIYNQKRFVNRGFLYGPLCPIYGSCGVLMIIFLQPASNNLVYLFIGGVIIGSAAELITGYLLDKLFNMKWWDYSGDYLNIKGYICIKFSIIWGFLAVFFIRFIHPLFEGVITFFLKQGSEVIYHLLLVALVVDVTITVDSLIRFRRFFDSLYLIRKELRENIDYLKDKAINRAREIKLRNRNLYLRQAYEKLSSNITFKHQIFLKSYPNLTSKKFGKLVEEVRNTVRQRKNNRGKL